MANEFFDVKKGLPEKDSALTGRLRIMLLFIVTAFGLAMLILFFGLAVYVWRQVLISEEVREVRIWSGLVVYVADAVASSLHTGLLALLVGVIQAWILRKRLYLKTQRFAYVLGIAGIVGGSFGGLFLGMFDGNGQILTNIIRTVGISDALLYDNWVRAIVWGIIGLGGGLIVGAITGGLGSILQNRVLQNSKSALRWFVYSVASWTVICGIAWPLAIVVGRFTGFSYLGDALASGFTMVLHGVFINVFLYLSPEFEFL